MACTEMQPDGARFTSFGVDECRAGWFCVSLNPSGRVDGFVVTEFAELVSRASDSDRVCVDIPIGLLDATYERRCDKLARKAVGRRRSSVFRVPTRTALDAETYEEACRINHAVSGKKLSKQTYGILPRIRKVDRLMRHWAKARRIVREVHPEVCFWALANGTTMAYNKKKEKGEEERLAVLESVRPSARDDFERMRRGFRGSDVARDDILDAMAAAITASATSSALQTLPRDPPKDDCGLPMQMVFAFGKAFAD